MRLSPVVNAELGKLLVESEELERLTIGLLKPQPASFFITCCSMLEIKAK